jgi:hypothetical protein
MELEAFLGGSPPKEAEPTPLILFMVHSKGKAHITDFATIAELFAWFI